MSGSNVWQWFSIKEADAVVLGGDLRERLSEAKSLLREGRRVFFCCHNPLGLKYFAGALPGATDRPFASLEGRMDGGEEEYLFYGKKELQELCEEAGLCAKLYYPYPDLTATDYVFTDDRGPGEGDFLRDAARCYDRELQLFHEGNVALAMQRQGAFGMVANDFVVELYETEPLPVTYVKLSRHRAAQFQIKTAIGGETVTKSPLTEAAGEHLRRMAELSGALCETCRGSAYRISPVLEVSPQGSVTFPLHQGKSLESMADARLMVGDIDGAEEILSSFIGDVMGFATRPFVVTDELRHILLGEDETLERALSEVLGEGAQSLFCTDLDLVPSNVLRQEDDPDAGCYIIDYEWSFSFPIPREFLIYRILRQYIDGRDIRRQCLAPVEDALYARYGIYEKERRVFGEMEAHFQGYITSGGGADTEAGERGLPDLSLEVYYDFGEGFSEEHKECLGLYARRGQTWHIPVRDGVKALRIDPAKCPGILHLKRLTDGEGRDNTYKTNMRRLETGQYYCVTNDPWLVVKLHRGQREVCIAYEYDGIL